MALIGSAFRKPNTVWLDSVVITQFVAIAESGSYRRAAAVLGVAQPALTVAMQKLEHSLGTPVFNRTPKGVSLTPAGEALLGYARRSLAVLEAGRIAAIDAASGREGALRIGFVGSAAYSFLPRVLPRFTQRYPGIRLELLENGTDSLLEELRAESLSACVVRQPIEANEEFEVLGVEDDCLVAAVPADHPLAGRANVALSELRDEGFVAFSSGDVPLLSAVVLQACAVNGFTPRIVQRARRVQTVVSLVACGLGVALVPGVATSFRTDSVRFVPLEAQDIEINLRLSLVWPRVGAAPAVRSLVEFLKESESQVAE